MPTYCNLVPSYSDEAASFPALQLHLDLLKEPLLYILRREVSQLPQPTAADLAYPARQ